ncbi:MAG: hypothetical protein K2Y39_07660, partial [Candidatus Obscuribacterales bacterium]|nr:hypothetical protein [Candidatus Obscuribacterales bacterium]
MLTKNRNEVLSLLLTGARLIDMPTLEQGYASSARLSTPLHKVLVMLGYVSQFKMDRVLHAETMIRVNELSPEIAVKALRMATTQQLTFEEALSALGDEHKKTQLMPSASNEITDLLVEAGCINNEQIGRALKTSLENGMQMGRVLVFHRDVTSQVMKAALSCCMLMQEEKIGLASAVEAVKHVRKTNMTVEQVLFQHNIYHEEPGQGPRVHELFAMAGFVSDTDMMECLELHILRGRQIGQIFIEQGLVNRDVLENAIVLQGMIASGAIKAFHAAEALRTAYNKEISIYQALGELNPPACPPTPCLTFGELLLGANLVKPETYDNYFEGLELTSRQIAKKLLAAGTLSDKACVTALRCLSLNNEGFLSNKDTIEILRHCVSYDANLDEQLATWAHFAPTRMQWIWR